MGYHYWLINSIPGNIIADLLIIIYIGISTAVKLTIMLITTKSVVDEDRIGKLSVLFQIRLNVNY